MNERIGMNGLTVAQLAGAEVYIWNTADGNTKYELWIDDRNRKLAMECIEGYIRTNTLMILENEEDRNEGMYNSTLRLFQFREMLEKSQNIVISGLSWSMEASLVEMYVDRIDGRA